MVMSLFVARVKNRLFFSITNGTQVYWQEIGLNFLDYIVPLGRFRVLLLTQEGRRSRTSGVK